MKGIAINQANDWQEQRAITHPTVPLPDEIIENLRHIKQHKIALNSGIFHHGRDQQIKPHRPNRQTQPFTSENLPQNHRDASCLLHWCLRDSPTSLCSSAHWFRQVCVGNLIGSPSFRYLNLCGIVVHAFGFNLEEWGWQGIAIHCISVHKLTDSILESSCRYPQICWGAW
jgi:hypothetical protein